MRILHCCLAAFYIDNYGYQENILPKMHKMQNHEVAILASTENYLEDKSLGYVTPRSYINEDNILVTRIPYLNSLPAKLVQKLRIYIGISQALNKFKPDILFIHDCQFIGIKEIAKYAQENPNVKIYVDSHTDFVNSGKNWVSKNILHKIIYKWCAKKIEPYTSKFYGTLPARKDFYRDVYGIDEAKLDLLVLGADHTVIDFNNRAAIRKEVREKLNIKDNDFVLVTGGKIDRRKRIHTLLRSFAKLEQKNIHLIFFGLANEDMKDEIRELSQIRNVHSIGWLKPKEIYNYLFAADLGIFPGTHSVLWEQCVGVGLPCIFRRWKGIQHVDVGGNCTFLEEDTEEKIKKAILDVANDEHLYNKMQKVSLDIGMKTFSYFEIAKKAIEDK